jgi:hypothetical protein
LIARVIAAKPSCLGKSIEEPESVSRVVRTATPVDTPVIVECATRWLSNLFERESHTPAGGSKAFS